MPAPIQPTDTSLPQWAINGLMWCAVALLSLLTGAYGWFMRKYILKIDTHADILGAMGGTYATISMVNDMEDKITGLVSRSELLAYMRELREEQLRMHKENLDAGSATRSDIRAVHERVDMLFRNGHAR